MAKPAFRPHSRYAKEAAELLGIMIQDARHQRKVTIAESAERAGISRGLARRIERGDMGCSIGAVFELAAILGIELFESPPNTLTKHLTTARGKLTLLPKKVRKSRKPVKNDF